MNDSSVGNQVDIEYQISGIYPYQRYAMLLLRYEVGDNVLLEFDENRLHKEIKERIGSGPYQISYKDKAVRTKSGKHDLLFQKR